MIGLALFLSLFVMAPTLTKINDVALQPLLERQDQLQPGVRPRRRCRCAAFMLDQTRHSELNLFINAAGDEKPARRAKTSR